MFRPSTGVWYLLQSSTGYGTYMAVAWGRIRDVPIQGDYDGDGKADIVVFRPSTGLWYILKSSTNFTSFSSYSWGFGNQFPVLRRQ